MHICCPQMLHGFGPPAAVLHGQLNCFAGNQIALVRGISGYIDSYTIDYTLFAQASWRNREGRISVYNYYPPGMRRRSDVSFWSHLGWDVADHIETSSRRRYWYVNERNLFRTLLRPLTGT